ncbi:hypothetical protein [Peterkaempfera bronchialis]|uniref:DUF4190 domain-containing protein n=1 Tax=Peterkaempfera bronchialis TaxID=2126346 RepID=A0A345SW45_9ACTN|nr:hypothetical protein [Peterkaempfera bronchialis]AXI77950.1 hypothetical protein C7M71_011375 [Peterkaempfera bronchialis]
MSNPYQMPPPDAYGGGAGQPYGGAPGYGQQQPMYGQPPPGYGYPAPQQMSPQMSPQLSPQIPQQMSQPVPYGMAPGPTGEPNSLATASAALGFVSVIVCFYGALLAPISLGFGIAGVNRARTTGTGRSAAVGGIVLSVLAILIAIAGLVLVVLRDKKTPV